MDSMICVDLCSLAPKVLLLSTDLHRSSAGLTELIVFLTSTNPSWMLENQDCDVCSVIQWILDGSKSFAPSIDQPRTVSISVDIKRGSRPLKYELEIESMVNNWYLIGTLDVETPRRESRRNGRSHTYPKVRLCAHVIRLKTTDLHIS